MKILIGIMYCIENELEECINAIKSQTHTNYEYFIIHNLPNKKAHQMLYKTFMSRAAEFDLFMKVDADMVINRNTFFSEVVDYCKEIQRFDLLQIALNDFFTDRMIYGLHVYSNRVRWPLNDSENIFVDSNASISDIILDNKILAPAATHCPDPSNFQAFHYGLHKAVKYLQNNSISPKKSQSFNHRSYINETEINFKKKKDIRMGYAVLGAYWGISNKINSNLINYDNQEVLEYFNKICDKGLDDLSKLITQNKPLIFRILPSLLAFEIFFLINHKQLFRPIHFLYNFLTKKNYLKSGYKVFVG